MGGLESRIRSGGEIRDEYGDIHPFDEFIAAVEATDPRARRRQFDWMRDHNLPISDRPKLDRDWLDDAGFSFTTSEFS